MCCWAIVEAKVGALVLGGRHTGIKRTDIGTYSVEALLALTGRTLHLVTGVRAEECEAIRLDWMADRAARGLSPR